MLIPSEALYDSTAEASLSRGMNANSQPKSNGMTVDPKSIKRDEC